MTLCYVTFKIGQCMSIGKKTRPHFGSEKFHFNEICNYQFITTRIFNTILHTSHVKFFIHHDENFRLTHALQSWKSVTTFHLLTRRKVRPLAETIRRKVFRKIQLFFATRRSYKNRNRKHSNIDSVTKTSIYLVTELSPRRRFTSKKNHITVGSVKNLLDMLVVGKSMRRQSTTKKNPTSVNFVTQVSQTVITEKCMKK